MKNTNDNAGTETSGLAAILIESQAAQIAALTAERDALRKALADLYRGYVNTLENGRDRIRMLGGECDDVPRMEESDPHLRAARASLNPTTTRSEP